MLGRTISGFMSLSERSAADFSERFAHFPSVERTSLGLRGYPEGGGDAGGFPHGHGRHGDASRGMGSTSRAVAASSDE